MDVNKITDIKELKALAYDELVKRDQAERNLTIINQRIAEIIEADPKTNKN